MFRRANNFRPANLRRRPVFEVLEWRDCPAVLAPAPEPPPDPPSTSPPVAAPDSFAVSSDGVIDVAASGILVNDTDNDGDTLSASLEVAPNNGTLVFSPDGSFTYTANDSFVGDDAFSYRALAGGESSELAHVNLHIALAALASEPLQVDVGQELSAALASVLVADANADPSGFSASISWGDGSYDTGQVVAVSPGLFSVVAAHTYVANGTYSATVTVVDSAGNLSTTESTVEVANVAPTMTLNITHDGQRTVTLSGQVTDDQPAGLTVYFSGQVGGAVMTAADGTFVFTTDAYGVGVIDAVVADEAGATSAIAQVVVSSSAPVITSFEVVRSVQTFTFQGTVADECPAGLTIIFGGDISSVAGQPVSVAADGTFSFTLELQEWETGLVSAQTTDWWGIDSGIATVLVSAS